MKAELLWSGDIPDLHNAGNEIFKPLITPYVVDGGGVPGPAIIVFPGGGYQMRAEHERTPIAEWLNSIGISAFVVDYRVKPYHHPVPLLDGQRAVRLVRYRAGEYRIDPGKIGVLGFSAGGHLASTVGTHYVTGVPGDSDPVQGMSSRPDAMVLCYPVISFGEWGHQGSKVNLLGDNPDPELARKLSNETQVTADTPPSFLWHTAEDAGVPVENSLLFASALGKAGVPFSLHVYPKGTHGLGLAQGTPYVSEWTTSCEKWFREIGFITT